MIDPNDRLTKVITGVAPDLETCGIYGSEHTNSPMPLNTISRIGDILSYTKSSTENDNKYSNENMNYDSPVDSEITSKRLQRTQDPIVLFTGQGDTELAMKTAFAVCRGGIFVGLQAGQSMNSVNTNKISVFPANLILEHAVKLNLTDFAPLTKSDQAVEPFVVISASASDSEADIYAAAARVPNVLSQAVQSNKQRKKILIDARPERTKSTNIATIVGNSLSWHGQNIGGFVAKTPSSAKEAQETASHLADLLTTRTVTARRNSIFSAISTLQ